MRIEVHHSVPEYASYRCARIRSLFNVDRSDVHITADLPLEGRDWQIGLIVGPSGSGKTTIGTRLFGPEALYRPSGWPADRPIIDALGPDLPIDEVTGALTSVGLGSVPAWLRPWPALSTGERFRADLARVLCERAPSVVVDEFTSVVDRQVARVGSSAFAKAWRRGAGQVVLLSCHYDIVEWLQPDWIFDTATGRFSGRGLQRRPDIHLDICETDWRWWPLFEPHHYLKLPRMIAATCYVGVVDDAPVAHLAMSTRPGMLEARMARIVVLPDWQGLGIGPGLINEIAGRWRLGENRFKRPMPTLINTAHPGLVKALRRDDRWVQVSARLHGERKSKSQTSLLKSASGSAATGYGGHFRAVRGFRYVDGAGDSSYRPFGSDRDLSEPAE